MAAIAIVLCVIGSVMLPTGAHATELAAAGRPAADTVPVASSNRLPAAFPRRPSARVAAGGIRSARSNARNGQVARFSPRTSAPLSGSAYHVLFSDYALFSAQEEVMAMGAVELGLLADVVRKCSGSHVNEAERLGCDLERSRFIFTYSSNRQIDRIIAATQFMTALAGYNRAIGRENEAGAALRLATVHEGLSEAVRLAGAARSASADRER